MLARRKVRAKDIAAQIGLSEASVLLRKIQSFHDPRLYALTQLSAHLANSKQPLVPQRVFTAGTNGHSPGENGQGQELAHRSFPFESARSSREPPPYFSPRAAR